MRSKAPPGRLGLALSYVPIASVFVLLVPLVALAWNASYSTIGRDQGIFQYIAWAVSQGDVDYKDVRDVNGPLTHLVHRIFLLFGSRDEHIFRSLDLAVTGAVFAFLGWMLPGISRKANTAFEEPSYVTRAFWSVASLVLLGAQYLHYLYWDLAQRESFSNWFMLPAALFALRALEPSFELDGDKKKARAWMISGALSGIAVFGKPTYAFFGIAIVFFLLLDREALLDRKQRFMAYALGVLVGVAAMVLFVVITGDLRAGASSYLGDARLYAMMWRRPAADIFTLPWGMKQHLWAGAAFGMTLLLVLFRQAPTRLLLLPVLPIVGYAAIVVQGKGFPYHFHPVSAGLQLAGLGVWAWAFERTRSETLQGDSNGRKTAYALAHVGAAVGSLLVGRSLVESSPFRGATDLRIEGAHRETRETEKFFQRYRSHDFFPWEMREVAVYLKSRTDPRSKVQTYGVDPYLLFLAERKSASPFIYAFDLNFDASAAGARDQIRDPSELSEMLGRLEKKRADHEAEMLEIFIEAPPAAFVFFDHAPFLSDPDALVDFATHNPKAASYLETNYELTKKVGPLRVWLRKDRGP